MKVRRVRRVVSWIIAVLLALGYGFAGMGKLTGAASEMFAGWGYPAWFALLIGVLELAGALGLLLPKLTRWAALGLAGIMIGAVFTHVSQGEGLQVLRPLIFLFLLATLRWLRRED